MEGIDARRLLLGALLVSGMAAGDATAQVSAADYQRAASMLGDRTAPLVDGAVRGERWLDDGSLVYARSAQGKTAWLRFDPASGKTAAAFDQRALADAMTLASGGKGKPADADKLTVFAVKRDGEALVLSVPGGDFRCDATGCTARAAATVATGSEPGGHA